MRRGTIGAAMLVIAGGLLLASNLGLIPLIAVGQLWSLVLVWIGISIIDRPRLDPVSAVIGALFIASGVLPILGALHILPFDWSTGRLWSLLWPLILIAVGLSYFKRPPRIRASWSWNDEEERYHHHGGRTISDVTYGRDPWVLDNLDVPFSFGDIDIDLTTAQISPGRHQVTVHGWAGDVTIMVPRDVGVKVRAIVMAGDIKVNNERRSGLNNSLEWQQGLVETETEPWIDLFVDVKAGDVKVHVV